jgi:hypothetical protein
MSQQLNLVAAAVLEIHKAYTRRAALIAALL